MLNVESHRKKIDERSHSLYTVVKRLCHALVVGSVFAMAVILLVLLQQYQSQWLTVQTQFSGESIARQYARLLEKPLATYLSANDSVANSNDIERVITALTEEPHIIGLAVFNSNGKYIAPLPQIPSVVTLSATDNDVPLTFVEDIHDENGTLLGYVNIHMNTRAILESPLSLRSQLLFIALILLGLALVIGVYLTRAFYKSRPWILAKLGQK